MVNETPTVPGSIYVPSTIKGGASISISWAGSTDPDGNLTGYILQRSVNGGGWGNIYQGAATSYTDSITKGWNTVAYRVCAYDSYNATSAYQTSPTRTVINNTAPSAPASITVPDGIKGGKTVAVSWGAASDVDNNLSGYRLERSVNSGTWSQIYQGTARSYTDSITWGWNTVAYRVRAYDAESAVSGYTTSPARTIFNNNAPGAPASITVPESVKGGSNLTVSWGAASDADNNLSGYRLERSVNSGTWSQIYQGANRSYTDSITWGWNTVAYRARAYDAENAVSGYTTSPARAIFNNNAPTAPATITTAGTVRGGKTFVISWGAATDVDGNLAGYQLERSVDGGAYAQLYQGTALTYTDSITRGWGAITYRVRAYDAEGAYSGYRTSAALTVVNNLAPVISGSDGSLGEHNTTFSQAYTITDDDGDPVTVTEKLDNQTLRTYTATLGAQNTLIISADQFLRVLNGSHTLTVTAADDHGGAAVRSWTFTKNVTAIEFYVNPLSADAMPERCVENIIGTIPAGASLLVEVCNNGFDTQPTWEDCTQQAKTGAKYFFSNKAKTADRWGFGIHVKVERGGAAGVCEIYGIGGNFE